MSQKEVGRDGDVRPMQTHEKRGEAYQRREGYSARIEMMDGKHSQRHDEKPVSEKGRLHE